MTAFGTALFTTVHEEGFRIDQSDPLIKIHDDLVNHWRTGPVVTGGSSVDLIDDLVHIHGLNGTVTYRLGEHLPSESVYVAERVSCTVEGL